MAALFDSSTYIGRSGTMTVETELVIPVTVLDARRAYGRTDLLVTPVGGSGSTWVNADRVKLQAKAVPVAVKPAPVASGWRKAARP